MWSRTAAFFERLGRIAERQLVDMRWLDALTPQWLLKLGIDPETPLGVTAAHIICDTLKLTILLAAASVIRAILNRIFSSPRNEARLCRGDAAAIVLAVFSGSARPASGGISLPSHLEALTRRGMSRGAAFAYLFTAPFADLLTMTLLLTTVFGVRKALIASLSCALTALTGGWLTDRLSRNDGGAALRRAEGIAPARPPRGVPPPVRGIAGDALREIAYVFPYIVLGAGAAAFIRNWLPDIWVHDFLGSADPLAALAAAALGLLVDGDPFGLLPILPILSAKGAPPGTLIAFALAAMTFTPSALPALKRAGFSKLPLALLYALTLIWIAALGMLFNTVLAGL